jgi:predicted methyltransferase
VLSFVLFTPSSTASELGRTIVQSNKLAESTFWHALRKLREKKIIRFGDGKPIALTDTGKNALATIAGKGKE